MSQPTPGGGAVLLDFRDTLEWRIHKAQQMEHARKWAERQAYMKTEAYRLEEEAAERLRQAKRLDNFKAFISREFAIANDADIALLLSVYDLGASDGEYGSSWDR